MSHPRPLPDANLPPYSGGRKQMLAAAVVGVAGIALTLLGMALSPQKALLAYLIAYVYWLGLAIGAVTLVMANYSAGARWNVTVRRLMVDEGFLTRDAEGKVYRVSPESPGAPRFDPAVLDVDILELLRKAREDAELKKRHRSGDR